MPMSWTVQPAPSSPASDRVPQHLAARPAVAATTRTCPPFDEGAEAAANRGSLPAVSPRPTIPRIPDTQTIRSEVVFAMCILFAHAFLVTYRKNSEFAVISSRTPEGWPNECPDFKNPVHIEPSILPLRDAPCPHCGHLLFFTEPSPRGIFKVQDLQDILEELSPMAA